MVYSGWTGCMVDGGPVAPGALLVQSVPSSYQSIIYSNKEAESEHEAASETDDEPVRKPRKKTVLPDPTVHRGLHDQELQYEWNETDRAMQEKIDKFNPSIRRFLNASCFRETILEHLQQPKGGEHLDYWRPVEKEACCNGTKCNNKLGRLPPIPPHENEDQTAPANNSAAWFALRHISDWCTDYVQSLIPLKQRRFVINGEMWMDDHLQFKLSKLFKSPSKNSSGKLGFSTWAGLLEKVPAMHKCENQDGNKEALVDFLIGLTSKARDDYIAYRLTVKEKKEGVRDFVDNMDIIPMRAELVRKRLATAFVKPL